MKKIAVFLCFTALIHGIAAQNRQRSNDSIRGSSAPQYHKPSMEIDHRLLYFDANVGYFPKKNNASWAGQISVGYCLNEQSAFGVALNAFGRDQIYQRYGMGTGFQYRHNFPRRFILKLEFGYLLLHKMYDKVLDKEMIYTSQNSKPVYYQLDAHWRLWRSLTIGIAAAQSGNLYFKRFINETQSTTDLWRINAFTIQLGIALDQNTMRKEK